MAKKVSKFFRIGVEGDTCDGRVISAQDIQEMAKPLTRESMVAALTWNICAASCLTVFLSVMAMWSN